MATIVANGSWITERSHDVLGRSLLSRQHKKQFYDSDSYNIKVSKVSNNKLLNRRIKFVKAMNPENGRPSSTSSHGSTSSTQISVIHGRQRSEFDFAKMHLFEESDIQRLMKWKTNTAIGCGLRNLGNSCFMNALLQCLCYTPPLQNYLASKHHGSRCRKKNTSFCAFCELEELFPQMLNAKEGQYATPKGIFLHLNDFSRLLRPGRQEDSHELLTNLIDNLQNCALKTEREKIKDPKIQETSVIHKIFGGYLRSQVKCEKCHKESNTYDAMLDLSLEIKGCHSVDAALKHYTSTETLDGDNRYFCSRCKKKRRAQKKLSIFEPPNVLSLHLKRFEFGNGSLMMQNSFHRSMLSNGYRSHSGFLPRQGKIDRHISFDETLDITHLQSYHVSSKVTYSLYGVLVHHGHSPNSGHYTSYVKAPNGSWYYMDDSSVRSTDRHQVLRSNAYILFYVRNEPKILYKSPGLSPRRSSENSMKSIENLLPNETPAILKLDDRMNFENKRKSSQSASEIEMNRESESIHRASINTKLETHKMNRPSTPHTLLSKTTLENSQEISSEMTFASRREAAPDCVNSNIISMKGKRHLTNEGFGLNNNNNNNNDGNDNKEDSDEPPTKRRKVSVSNGMSVNGLSQVRLKQTLKNIHDKEGNEHSDWEKNKNKNINNAGSKKDNGMSEWALEDDGAWSYHSDGSILSILSNKESTASSGVSGASGVSGVMSASVSPQQGVTKKRREKDVCINDNCGSNVNDDTNGTSIIEKVNLVSKSSMFGIGMKDENDNKNAKLMKNYIGEKDEWDANIDFERSQRKKQKSKKFPEKWKEYRKKMKALKKMSDKPSSVKNFNAFDALHGGNIKKRKKFVKSQKHKKSHNFNKRKNRNRLDF